MAAAPESSTTAAQNGCGGCTIVADVAGIVWYSEIFINTAATAVVSINNGNGTSGARVTRTSVVRNEGQFTFNPQAGSAAFGTVPAVNIGYSSITTIAGATLYVSF